MNEKISEEIRVAGAAVATVTVHSIETSAERPVASDIRCTVTQKFIGLLTLVLSVVFATGADDIRIKFIGETHAELYIGMLKRFFPEYAGDFDKIWEDFNKG